MHYLASAILVRWLHVLLLSDVNGPDLVETLYIFDPAVGGSHSCSGRAVLTYAELRSFAGADQQVDRWSCSSSRCAGIA